MGNAKKETLPINKQLIGKTYFWTCDFKFSLNLSVHLQFFVPRLAHPKMYFHLLGLKYGCDGKNFAWVKKEELTNKTINVPASYVGICYKSILKKNIWDRSEMLPSTILNERIKRNN